MIHLKYLYKGNVSSQVFYSVRMWCPDFRPCRDQLSKFCQTTSDISWLWLTQLFCEFLRNSYSHPFRGGDKDFIILNYFHLPHTTSSDFRFFCVYASLNANWEVASCSFTGPFLLNFAVLNSLSSGSLPLTLVNKVNPAIPHLTYSLTLNFEVLMKAICYYLWIFHSWWFF